MIIFNLMKTNTNYFVLKISLKLTLFLYYNILRSNMLVTIFFNHISLFVLHFDYKPPLSQEFIADLLVYYLSTIILKDEKKG